MPAPNSPPLDWRYRTVTELTQPFKSPYTGATHPVGTPVSKATFVLYNGNQLRIGDPSAPALYLDLSYKSYQEAIRLHPFLRKWPLPKKQDPSRLAYDYLEAMMSSIVFAYTSLEAWANEEIPEDFREERQRRSGVFFFLTKPSAERQLSLSEKLASILPKVLGVPTPKGLKVWEDFVHLKDIRDRIIHLKSADRAASKADSLYPASVWSILLNPRQPSYPSWAKQVILHFVSQEKYHWLKYCPV